MSVEALIFVVFRIMQPGSSSKMKNRIIFTILSFVLVYVIWTANSLYQFYEINETEKQSWLIAMALIGLPMALVRLSEPFVFQEFKKAFFGSKE